MKQMELDNLLEDMSLEEKVYQLLQVTGGYFFEDAVLTGPEAALDVDVDKVAMCGSVLSLYGAKNIRQAQDKIMARQPHHIPALFMYDVIHGLKTINQVPLGLGCTFNPELIKEGASMTAKESAISGLHVVFSPMSDLCRDPRWGRVMEGTGEDKYLNSICTKAMVEGYQGNDPKEKYKVGSCVKHFAAYGKPDGGRDYNTVEVSNRTLFEDYLPAYEAGVKAGAVSVMTSFNTIDRIPCSANRHLLRNVLRKKMGFDGVLLSDHSAIVELISHGIAENEKAAAEMAIQAGVDIDMMSPCYVDSLCKLVESGEIDEKLIDEAVMRVLVLKNRLGLFENPYKDTSEIEEETLILSKENREIARRTAEESFVLLENDGILPLRAKEERIAFIGPYTDNKELFGSWAIAADGKDSNSVKDVIESLYPDNEYVFASGCNMMPADSLLEGLGSSYSAMFTEEEEKEAMKQAVLAAKANEKVVMMLGEHRLQSGEAASVGDITIPKKQLELLEQVAKVNPNIVVVLFNGRPLDLREVKKYAKAILEVWFPGTEGAVAIADTLFGKNNPSGKLSMSFPYCVGQIPVHYDEFHTGRRASDTGEKCKFSSCYEDIPNSPLYPFGYGKSYSDFTYSKQILSKDILSKNTSDSIKASVTVKNASEIDGSEVVQLYIRDVKGSVVRPVRELKGFEKINLKAGEEKEVTFVITEEMLRFYDIDMEFTSECGDFEVYIGSDSREQHALRFKLID